MWQSLWAIVEKEVCQFFPYEGSRKQQKSKAILQPNARHTIEMIESILIWLHSAPRVQNFLYSFVYCQNLTFSFQNNDCIERVAYGRHRTSSASSRIPQEELNRSSSIVLVMISSAVDQLFEPKQEHARHVFAELNKS